MKKWMYVVFPGIMLALFLIVYTSHVKEAEQREVQRQAKLEADIAAEKQKRKEAEERAAVDAQKRQKEREEEDRKKEADRRKKKEAQDKEISDDYERYKNGADEAAKTAGQLEIELDRLRKQRDDLSREDFALAKEVEKVRIDKQNAEMRQQHMTAMIAQRAQNSAMAAMPPPPPPPKR
jgi:hypothetical protein